MDQLIGLLAMYVLPLVACLLYVRTCNQEYNYATKEGIVVNDDLYLSFMWIGAITPLFNFVMMLYVAILVLVKKL